AHQRRARQIVFIFCALKGRNRRWTKKGPSRCGRPKSREETPKEGCDRPSAARRCRTAKYRMGIPERKVQKLQSCHYRREGQYKSNFAQVFPGDVRPCQDIGVKKRPFERANGPSLGRKRPYWAAVAKKCFIETADFVCACSRKAAT